MTTDRAATPDLTAVADAVDRQAAEVEAHEELAAFQGTLAAVLRAVAAEHWCEYVFRWRGQVFRQRCRCGRRWRCREVTAVLAAVEPLLPYLTVKETSDE